MKVELPATALAEFQMQPTLAFVPSLKPIVTVIWCRRAVSRIRSISGPSTSIAEAASALNRSCVQRVDLELRKERDGLSYIALTRHIEHAMR
jgi:hypothetical protein